MFEAASCLHFDLFSSSLGLNASSGDLCSSGDGVVHKPALACLCTNALAKNEVGDDVPYHSSQTGVVKVFCW